MRNACAAIWVELIRPVGDQARQRLLRRWLAALAGSSVPHSPPAVRICIAQLLGAKESSSTGSMSSSPRRLRKSSRVIRSSENTSESSSEIDSENGVLDLVQSIEAAGVPIEHIDFGGGLGIDYHGDTPPQADALWQQLLKRLDERGFGDRKIVIEPGRSLVGNAGVCLTEVLYRKPGEQKNFLIVDAAMNDLPRPAMYQAFHRIVEVAPREEAPTTWDVVGPVCESGDWLGRDRALAAQSGDVLAVLSAGAYCMSMASNYNTRGRAAEVLVDGNTATLIRARESAADQLRLETLLPPA